MSNTDLTKLAAHFTLHPEEFELLTTLVSQKKAKPIYSASIPPAPPVCEVAAPEQDDDINNYVGSPLYNGNDFDLDPEGFYMNRV